MASWDLPTSALTGAKRANIKQSKKINERSNAIVEDIRASEIFDKSNIIIKTWLFNMYGKVPRYIGIESSYRVRQWGSIASKIEYIMREYICNGLGVKMYALPSIRPYFKVGTWSFGSGVAVTPYFVFPALITSVQKVESSDDVIRLARSYIDIQSPSTNDKDTYAITKRYGSKSIAGRLSQSIISILETEEEFKSENTPMVMPVQVHYGSSRLLFCLKYADKIYNLIISVKTMPIIKECVPSEYTAIKDYYSISIYTDRPHSNSIIRLTVDGNIKFLGVPSALRESYLCLTTTIIKCIAKHPREFIASLKVIF